MTHLITNFAKSLSQLSLHPFCLCSTLLVIMQSSTMTDHNGYSASSSLIIVPHGTDRITEGRRRAALLLARSSQEEDLVIRGAHPDLIELSAPAGKEKIGIAQVREVIHQAQFAPTQARQKVCLLPRAEQLTMEAANALLKVLEEPPRGLVFLFLAENPGDLLATIVSRSQIIRERPSIDVDSVSRLTQVGYEEREAHYIVDTVENESELEQFIAHPIDLAHAKKEASQVAAEATGTELITLARGNDSIVRRAAASRLLLRLTEGDRELAVTGAIAAARAGRDAAARLLANLISISFSALREAIEKESAPRTDRLGLLSIDPAVWGVTCRRIQRAQRGLDRYTYPDGVFLSLFLSVVRGE